MNNLGHNFDSEEGEDSMEASVKSFSELFTFKTTCLLNL